MAPAASVIPSVSMNKVSAGQRGRRRSGGGGGGRSMTSAKRRSRTSSGKRPSPLPVLLPMRFGCVARNNRFYAANSYSGDEHHLALGFRSRSRGSRRKRLQFLAGLEASGLARRDTNLLSSARVAADAGLARLYVEHAKAAEFDAF